MKEYMALEMTIEEFEVADILTSSDIITPEIEDFE